MKNALPQPRQGVILIFNRMLIGLTQHVLLGPLSEGAVSEADWGSALRQKHDVLF